MLARQDALVGEDLSAAENGELVSVGYYSSNIISNIFWRKKEGKKRWENWGKSEIEKNEKELGRTDGRFEISRSKSPYPQILVPNGPL